jgi:hypothetical protein
MKDTSHKEKFETKVEDDFDLYFASDLAGTFRIKIRASEIHGSPLDGSVIVDTDGAGRISECMRKCGSRIRIVSKTSIGALMPKIEAEGFVTVERLLSAHIASWHEERFSISLDWIEYSHKESKNGTARSVIISLDGSRDYWYVYSYIPHNSSGELTIESNSIDLSDTLASNSTVRVDPKLVKKQLEFDERPCVYTDIPTLRIESHDSSQHYSDEDFLKDALSFGDDFVLLGPLLNGKRIGWFKYEFNHKSGNTTHYKSSRECRDTEDFDGLIDHKLFKPFLDSALKSIYVLSTEDQDLLRDTIELYVLGMETKVLRERFLHMFSIFELIRIPSDSVSRLTLSRSEFNKVCERLSSIIGEMVHGVDSQKKLKMKLKSINRESIRDKLLSVCTFYDTGWTDLYPPDYSFDFIGVRNKLIHGAERIPSDKLHRETERVTILASRLIMAALGWKGRLKTPDEQQVSYLQSID